MAVAMLISLWVYDELSFNKYHRKPRNSCASLSLALIWGGEKYASTSHVTGLGTLLKTEYGSHFKNVAMVRGGHRGAGSCAFGENKFTQSGYFMQTEGAEMLTLNMILRYKARP
jgi:putative ABC transport system permease protein